MKKISLLSFILFVYGCAAHPQFTSQKHETVHQQANYKFKKYKRAGDKLSFVLVKYDERSGRSYFYTRTGWAQIQDLESIPESKYRIEIVEYNNGNWQMFRLDSNTGRAWKAKGKKWIETPDRAVGN